MQLKLFNGDLRFFYFLRQINEHNSRTEINAKSSFCQVYYRWNMHTILLEIAILKLHVKKVFKKYIINEFKRTFNYLCISIEYIYFKN